LVKACIGCRDDNIKERRGQPKLLSLTRRDTASSLAVFNRLSYISQGEIDMSVAKRAADQGVALVDPPKNRVPKKPNKAKATSTAETPKADPSPAKAKESKPKDPVDPMTKPLTSKAMKMLALLAIKETASRKTIISETKLTSADFSAYMGATQNAKYKHWDEVAKNPNDSSCLHVSLIGRGFVTYKEGVQTEDQGKQVMFTITTEGLKHFDEATKDNLKAEDLK